MMGNMRHNVVGVAESSTVVSTVGGIANLEDLRNCLCHFEVAVVIHLVSKFMNEFG